MKKIWTLILTTCLIAGCDGLIVIPNDFIDNDPEQENPGNDTPELPDISGGFTTESLNDPGISYVWDDSVIPEITIHMTTTECHVKCTVNCYGAYSVDVVSLPCVRYYNLVA